MSLPRRARGGVAFAELAVFLVLAALAGAALAAGAAEPDPTEQTLAAIRECMAKLPPPWPQAWQAEYVDTIRGLILSHQDAPQYGERLQIVRQGFPPYWEALKKGPERSLFEVHCAEIRWYVESLMKGELAGAAEKQKLRDQWQSLMNEAATALVAQFPFLDPNVVQAAKADYLAGCYRDIEAPLLPTLRHAFSQEQIAQLKEAWTKLRYARVDLWRQLGGVSKDPAGKNAGTATGLSGREEGPSREIGVPGPPDMPDAPLGKTHPDYLLTQRSLDRLRGQLWSLLGSFPDYYREAVAKEIAGQKQRLKTQADARAQESRLGVAVWQTEYLSFLLAALLETAQTPGNTTLRSGESSGDRSQGETHEER